MNASPGVIAERPKLRDPASRRSTVAARRIGAVAADPDIRRSALSVFDQATVSITNFATSVIIGWMCSQESLGVYYLALTMVLFCVFS